VPVTRKYEVVYIFDGALEEAQVNERLDRFHALLKSPAASEPITSVNHWGKRSLAYPLKGKEIGYYVVAQFQSEPPLLPEFERAIKLDDGVIRYLVVLNEGEAPRPVRVPTADDDDEGPEEAEDTE
jgi:small subunit ribosomal protein S6